MDGILKDIQAITISPFLPLLCKFKHISVAYNDYESRPKAFQKRWEWTIVLNILQVENISVFWAAKWKELKSMTAETQIFYKGLTHRVSFSASEFFRVLPFTWLYILPSVFFIFLCLHFYSALSPTRCSEWLSCSKGEKRPTLALGW